MTKQGWKHWLMTRFVVIAEVMGYSIALAVIGFAIATVFIEQEVTISFNAELAPVRHDMVFEAESAIARYDVPAGAMVKAGQPVGVGAIAPGSMERTLAQGLLEAASVWLDAADAAAGARVREIAANLQTGQVTLEASADGMFQPLVAPPMNKPLPPDTAFATVLDLDQLEMWVSLSAKQKDRVRVGQAVRASHPASATPVLGEVRQYSHGETGTDVLLVFPEVPAAVRDAYAALLAESDSPGLPPWPAAPVKIVVDSQSLFTKLFSKRQ